MPLAAGSWRGPPRVPPSHWPPGRVRPRPKVLLRQKVKAQGATCQQRMCPKAEASEASPDCLLGSKEFRSGESEQNCMGRIPT